MKKALPFAITLLFVCPILSTTPASANDGGKSKGSPSVLHQSHGESWLEKAWDDLLDLFRSHHDKGQDKDNGKGPGDKGDKDHKGDPKNPGHQGDPGSGNNGNNGSGNGGNNGGGDNGNGGGGGNSGGGDGGGGGSMPLPPSAPGGGMPSGGSSPSAPIDGGISLLLAAGVGLGVKKIFPKRDGHQEQK
ncbi:MAG: hypothetical protein JST42_03115 [Bacteroidetes bacterium]|nr:hypothetical protein [Bacteroidota bacterium]